MKRSEREALVEGLTEIDYLINELELSPAVKQRSTELYRKSVEDGSILPGRGINQIVAGAVLLATRESNDVTNAKVVASKSNSGLTKTVLHRITKDMQNELSLGVVLADPHKYVDKLHDDLRVDDDLISLTHEAVDLLIEDGATSGKKASAIAGACFYAMTRCATKTHSFEKYTQHEICHAIDVSEVTIRNNYTDFQEVILDNYEQLNEDALAA